MTDSELQSVGAIEVDTFCPHCQFNLFGQPVCRDQRLEILVSKCPGCARFIAAGKTSTAGSRWLQTVTNGMILGYVGFLICVILVAGIIIFATQTSYLEDLRYRNDASRTISYVYTIVGACITPGLLGCFLAVFCWHWRRGLRYLAAAIPVATGGLAFLIWAYPQYGDNSYTANSSAMVLLLILMCWQIAVFAIAMLLGRPIGRLVLRLLVPAKLLKAISLLWTVDGKTPPA